MRKLYCTLVIGLLLLSLVACGTKTPPPGQTVKAFMNALVKADYVNMAKYIDNNQDFNDLINAPDAEEGLEIIEATLAKITYELGTETITGDTASVAMKVTAPDLAQISAAVLVEVMPAAFALAFSGEDAQEEISAMFLGAFVKHIENTEAPMTTSDVTVKLTLKSNSWTIVPDDALVNAITGNLQKVWEELDQGDE